MRCEMCANMQTLAFYIRFLHRTFSSLSHGRTGRYRARGDSDWLVCECGRGSERPFAQ